jgi:hypothetical protein
MRMTFREIALAWQGKQDLEWMQTAEVIAAIYNIRPRGRGDTKVYRGSEIYSPSDEVKRKENRGSSSVGTKLTVGLLRELKSAMFGIKETPCKSR